MKFPKRKPYLLVFIPWVHIQEVRQAFSEKSDYWVRHLRIGRFVILWNAPENGTPNRVAHIRDTHETKLRIPKEDADA